MGNSILKSYLKKFIRSEAFVSLIIVFVLAIGIIGTSYALYMDVDTDTNYQLVEVGDLSVGFDNGDSMFTLNYLTPTEDDIATGKVESDVSREISSKNFFSFYIYNNGNYTANYNIKLVPLEGSISSDYLRFQICKDNIENCKDIKTLNEVENNIIFNDELSPNRTESQTNPSAYYFLRVWVKSDYEVNENDKVILKVEIDAKNASGYLDNDNTLVGRILSDDRVIINNNVPDFSETEINELGLFKTEDDYGISYYYRGAQNYNYVNFAGMCWRIVRIEGDGSTKLILEDRNAECNSASFTGNWSDGNTYVFGYDNSSGSYRLNFLNYSGGLADSFKNFQTTKLTTTDLEKLKIDEWCYDDKVTLTDENGDEYYGAYTRIYTNKKPSLNCTGTKLTKYRDNTNMYVGTLTADEMSFAGAYSATNNNFYLMNSYAQNNGLRWWALSPSVFFEGGGGDYALSLNGYGYLNDSSVDDVSSRPAVSLKSGAVITSGDGTLENPYVIG